MTMKKKPMALRKDEDQLLRKHYVRWRIPRGQYKKHPDYLAEFTRGWNNDSGRSDSAIEVLHYVETQQKITVRLDEPWPTFKGTHKRLAPVETITSAEHMLALRGAYSTCILPLDIGTDGLAYREDLLEMLSKEFAKRTGLCVPGMLLAACCENERKKGLWYTLRTNGFDDLDSVRA